MKTTIFSLDELHPPASGTAFPELIRQVVTAWLTKELAKEV